jgi:glycopeptide antibiotics resistance protein
MKKNLIATFILILYTTILIMVLVFKEVPAIRTSSVILNFGGSHEGQPNLVPFRTILPFLLGEKGFFIAFINLAGNIFLLIPVGFLVPFVYRNMTWKKCIVVAVLAGLILEGMQALLHVGIFDIDDVLLNGFGVIIGFWLFTILAKRMSSAKVKNLLVASAIVTVVATVFYIVAIYQKPKRLEHFERNVVSEDTVQVNKDEAGIQQGKDPCNGTGGTGQIISLGTNSFTIKRNDGIDQIITLSNKAKISNSAGPLSLSDLKAGDRVTVVVMPDQRGIETATTVLVCNISNPEKGK